MLKRVVVAGIVLGLLSTTAVARGWYAGLGVGPQFVNFSQDAKVVMPGSFNATDKTHNAGTGVFGSLFAGYVGHIANIMSRVKQILTSALLPSIPQTPRFITACLPVLDIQCHKLTVSVFYRE